MGETLKLAWTPRALLYALAATQTAHFFEHVAQMVQIHLLGWAPPEAHGVVGGQLDVEWVHFAWNTLVLVAVVALLWSGAGSRWLWAALPLVAWHGAEHAYIIATYVQTGAAGTPGLLARGGLVLGGLPLSRPDLHFIYNLLETAAIIAAAPYVDSRAPIPQPAAS